LPARRPPQRTCIACRSTSGKRELVRIVRTPAGSVELDETGKKSGRGAYLCKRVECWETGLKRDRLANALKTRISDDDRMRLSQVREGLKDVAVV
jgi:predicted RNA-binding protein YlxR (DUF448 family)